MKMRGQPDVTNDDGSHGSGKAPVTPVRDAPKVVELTPGITAVHDTGGTMDPAAQTRIVGAVPTCDAIANQYQPGDSVTPDSGIS